MKAGFVTSFLALASSAVASPSLAERQSKIPSVSVKGNQFVKEDGSRFFIRGVDYQPGGASDPKDPIGSLDNCQRDIKHFADLGINTVRVYSVDNSKNHDACMNELAANGIYLALDVNSDTYSITRTKSAQSYNEAYLQHVFATIDAFAKYPNTLLFFCGNEVINNPTNTQSAPYVKAVQRDMRQYIKARGYRTIPVGYSAADVSSNQYQSALYFNCGGDEQRGDFFSFNNYEWCAPSSFQQSGWDQKVAQYKNYGIPIFLSEFGCATNPPRPFTEIGALYGPQMTAVFSGGLVYEYSQEPDKPNMGLVMIEGNNANPLHDYYSLKNELAKNPAPSDSAGGSSTPGKASNCPPQNNLWNTSPFQGSDLPAIPGPALDFIKNGAGPGKGLSGGTQTSGGAMSSGTQSAGNGPAASQSGGSASSGAASPGMVPPGVEMAPIVIGAIVVLSSMVGATLL